MTQSTPTLILPGNPEFKTPGSKDFAELVGGNEEACRNFFIQFCTQVLHAWCDNDTVIALIVPEGYVESATAYLKSVDTSYFNDLDQKILESELAALQIAVGAVSHYQIMTRRDALSARTAAFLKNWASETGLMKYIQENNIPFIPSTDMLGMAYLLTSALPESQQSRILMPNANMLANLR